MSSAVDHSYYLLACVAGTVALLLLLVGRLRLHAAIGLSVAAFALGIVSGIGLERVPVAFSSGAGEMMQHIAIILGMGAILGQLLASSGAGTALGSLLVHSCGPKGMPWALLLLGILVGMPVFFEVGLVLLLPIIAEAARSRPRRCLSLCRFWPDFPSCTDCFRRIPRRFWPRHNIPRGSGRTIFWGMVAGIPAAALAGPGLGWFLTRRWQRRKAKGAQDIDKEEDTVHRAAVGRGCCSVQRCGGSRGF